LRAYVESAIFHDMGKAKCPLILQRGVGHNKTIPVHLFLDFCIGYILIKLDAKYYYNATTYKYFIHKVYDLVGQPSYTVFQD